MNHHERNNVSATVSNLRMNLEGEPGAYYLSIGFDGNKPLLTSRCFSKKQEMREAIGMAVQCIAQDNFEVFDYTTGKEEALAKSEVVSVVQLPGNKSVWQIVSKHGWVLQLAAQTCPCKKHTPMLRYGTEVHVDGEIFTIKKIIDSPVGCHVYVVEPAKAKVAKKGKTVVRHHGAIAAEAHRIANKEARAHHEKFGGHGA